MCEMHFPYQFRVIKNMISIVLQKLLIIHLHYCIIYLISLLNSEARMRVDIPFLEGGNRCEQTAYVCVSLSAKRFHTQ